MRMLALDDVARIALALPQTEEVVEGHRGGRAWRTKNGMFVWERGPTGADLTALDAAGREWPDGAVVGIRTDGLHTKEALLEANPDCLFTIPHFDGYPAVLVRLDRVDPALLRELIVDAWLDRAPKRVAREYLAAER
ncbi:hypothetical protein DSM26151_17410 [Agromyces marinus]|nr:hypothetical protein DSM26151_17410 [Agromyces marinus]